MDSDPKMSGSCGVVKCRGDKGKAIKDKKVESDIVPEVRTTDGEAIAHVSVEHTDSKFCITKMWSKDDGCPRTDGEKAGCKEFGSVGQINCNKLDHNPPQKRRNSCHPV